MALRITLVDGTVLEPSGDPTFSDNLALERHMGSTTNAENRQIEAGVFFMWRLLRRDGAAVPDEFEAFVDLIADVTESKNGKAPAPKAKAAPSK
jgi:hypothetical protein